MLFVDGYQELAFDFEFRLAYQVLPLELSSLFCLIRTADFCPADSFLFLLHCKIIIKGHKSQVIEIRR